MNINSWSISTLNDVLPLSVSLLSNIVVNFNLFNCYLMQENFCLYIYRLSVRLIFIPEHIHCQCNMIAIDAKVTIIFSWPFHGCRYIHKDWNRLRQPLYQTFTTLFSKYGSLIICSLARLQNFVLRKTLLENCILLQKRQLGLCYN